MLKKLLASSLLLVILSTLTPAVQKTTLTERFNSPEGQFNILMPAKPTLEAEDVDSPLGKLTIHMYSSSNSTSYFLASYGDYPVAPKNANHLESVLDGVRDGIQAGSKSELVSETKILVYGHTGREFTTRTTIQGEVIIFNCRIFLVGRRLYQLAVATPERDSTSPDIAKFLTSFALNK